MHKLTNEQSRRMSELLNDVTGTSRQTLFEEALKMGRDSAAVEQVPVVLDIQDDEIPADLAPDSLIVPADTPAADTPAADTPAADAPQA